MVIDVQISQGWMDKGGHYVEIKCLRLTKGVIIMCNITRADRISEMAHYDARNKWVEADRGQYDVAN